MGEMKHAGLRIEKDLNQKFKYVCGYYGELASETLRAKLKEHIAQGDWSETESDEPTNVSICLGKVDMARLKAVTRNEGTTVTGVTRNIMKAYVKAFEEDFGEIPKEDLDKI